MRLSSIKGYLVSLVMAGSTALLPSCTDGWNNSERLHQYLRDRGDTQAYLDSLLDITKNDDYAKECVQRQSKLDSIAYRDLLYSTHVAKNSAAVKEFNKVAAKANLSSMTQFPYYHAQEYKDTFLRRAKSENLIILDADRLIDNFPDECKYSNSGKYAADVQHYVDKYFYGSFFKRHRLMIGDFKIRFDSIANVLKK